MKRLPERMRRAALGAATMALLSWSSAMAADIAIVHLTPLFETAGVIIQTGEASVTLEVRKLPDGKFLPAHPFVRFDAQHMAGSLFSLKPNTEYEVRVGGSQIQKFATLAEPSIPEAKQVVKLSPGQSLAQALKAAAPGTEIRLAPGAYPEEIILNGKQGTAGNPIVIRGEIGPEEMKKPIQERKLPVIDASGKGAGIYLEGCAYILIDSVQIRKATNFGVRFTGSQWCTLQNCQIYDNGKQYNVLLSKGGASQHHIFVRNNHIADLEHTTPQAYDYKGAEDITYYGIKRDNSPGWAAVLSGNVIEGQSDGLATSGDEAQATAAEESLPDLLAKWPNYEVDVYDNRVSNCRDDAIETDGICVNQRVFRNTFTKTQGVISISPSLPGPYWFLRNLCFDYNETGVKLNTAKDRGVIRNCFFYHNTFVRRDKTADGKGTVINLWDGTPSKNIVFRNNLFLGTERCVQIQPERTHQPDFDYDLWFCSGDAAAFVWWTKPMWKKGFPDGWVAELGCDKNGVWGDPKLDDQFRPQEGSAAIDKGAPVPGINDDFAGKAPDIGAVEKGK